MRPGRRASRSDGRVTVDGVDTAFERAPVVTDIFRRMLEGRCDQHVLDSPEFSVPTARFLHDTDHRAPLTEAILHNAP